MMLHVSYMRITIIGLVFITFAATNSYAQNILGQWKTIDDVSGKARSVVEITESDGKYYGKVIEMFLTPEEGTDPVCEFCKGNKKNKPIMGMEIIWGMKPNGPTKLKGGKIMDPENGKTYGCKIELVSENELNVRGFLGISLLGRTQTWYRAENL